MKRKNVYKLIDEERAYQDTRWNPDTTETGGKHSPAEWLVYIQSYLTEAIEMASRLPDPLSSRMVLHNIRKITAMGVACMEQNKTESREVEGR